MIRIAVVIPCYRVVDHIREVVQDIGPEVDRIYCIDDKCPDGSGEFIRSTISDKRVTVIFHEANQGVGGATATGYKAALADGAEVVVKLDGDGQMDAGLIGAFVSPILEGNADYTKGNRFFRLEDVRMMPRLRLFGNAVLSFFSKFSTGYWNIFDPTNGYTAIHSQTLKNLPLDEISRDYFFESDMLFRLNTLGAVVIDVPMAARYGKEASNLRIRNVAFLFFMKHTTNFAKRIFYNYYLRDFNVASIELLLGTVLLTFGAGFGLNRWMESAASGVPATAGTVMLAAFPALAGLQLLLGFLNFDIQNTPSFPLQKRIGYKKAVLPERAG
jgi:glycosyltransferase involved in cell wall biosynthesis